jgi:hypothetical protein
LHQNTLASSNPKLIKIPMHQNIAHIYAGEGRANLSVACTVGRWRGAMHGVERWWRFSA